ncbi:MAG: HNH endonuclease [Bacteroidales bacterium]|nr:HNH endonuclease [Bacteroidales bacterium]
MSLKEKMWGEEWRQIIDVNIHPEPNYQVSNYGRIRRWNADENEWKILKSSSSKKDGTGYHYYSFKTTREGVKSHAKSVHRIVAEAFCVPEKPIQTFVIHLDHDFSNNRSNNLKFVSRRELTEHSKKSPRAKVTIGNAKLTSTEVIRLKKKLKRSSMPLYKIAKEFGITHTQLNRIRKGENWGHIVVD